MRSWLLLRRLRGPAFLILVGITALLNQSGVLSFRRSWPLYLILAGVFGLAERAVLASTPSVPPSYPGGYPVSSYPVSSYPATSSGPGSGYNSGFGVPAVNPAPASAAEGSNLPGGEFTDPDRRS
jgi:hypothetical protein